VLMNFATFAASFFFIFKHLEAPKRSWKISRGVSWKVLDFFVSKRVGTMWSAV